jgi:hypothetical protein
MLTSHWQYHTAAWQYTGNDHGTVDGWKILFSNRMFGLAGFLLRSPATVLVGGQPAQILKQSTSSIAFLYPATLSSGEYPLAVKLGKAVSNVVTVQIQEPGAGQIAGIGGPVSSQYNFTVTSIDFPVWVRDRSHSVRCYW